MALSKIDSDGIVANGITADSLNIGQIGGRRNLIINGAMQVAQRGTSVTGVASTGYYTCDRWRWSVSNLGTWTTRQSTDAPDGFATSFNAECTTADSSPASNDSLFLYHAFEGKDLQGLAYGSSNAKSVTLSFLIKCNKTGNFQVNWKNIDSSELISNVQTINTADTWEQKTVTFVGNTSNGFDFDTNKSAQLEMWFDSGSSYQTNPTDTSWASIGSGESQAYGVDLDLGDTIGNEIFITGVQLEVGDTATPFEHRSYGEEEMLCRRYCQLITRSTSAGDVADNKVYGANYGSSGAFIQHPFVPPMRDTPDLSYSRGGSNGYDETFTSSQRLGLYDDDDNTNRIYDAIAEAEL